MYACIYIYARVHAYMRMCMKSEFYGSYHGKILELVNEYKQRSFPYSLHHVDTCNSCGTCV